MFKKTALWMSILALQAAGLNAAHAQGLTIDEAYEAIPKERVIYDPYSSTLDAMKAAYLNDFFTAIDDAVVLRVELLQLMYYGYDYDMEYYRAAYEQAINKLMNLQTPHDHYQTQSLVVEALREQWQFFEEWHGAESHMKDAYKNYASHPYVKSSSRKLISAYNIFMKLYPGEANVNKKAFYTHLCALDFI